MTSVKWEDDWSKINLVREENFLNLIGQSKRTLKLDWSEEEKQPQVGFFSIEGKNKAWWHFFKV